MGRFGCNIDGYVNDTKFSEPMPWIGVYVAAASLLCSMGMAADAIGGFRCHKLWFPCKFFSLNATSLTLIAVAIKLSVDLNTSMPRRQDQLAKLSSAVFMCTVMGNSMPSLGTMENKEIFMNIVALGILVITLVVNICIQLGTGVIYVFWKEHAFIMFLMLSLLVLLSFSALTIPTTKHHLELKYRKKYGLALKEGLNETGKPTIQKLKEDLMKYWMMAHTCSPQFVVGRSVTCAAAGALCLLSLMILAEAILRSYLMPWSFQFCIGESDYQWSTSLILVTQTIAVGLGTIAPAFRWFAAINFRCPKRGNKTYKHEFKVESYWLQRLIEMKECPLALKIHNRHCRKLAHDMKNKFSNMCILIQTGIVLVSKVIRFISIFFVSRIILCCDFCKKLTKLKSDNSISNDLASEPQRDPKLDLSRFVLHLEDEDALVEVMITSNCDATGYWMRMGKGNQPKHLIELLELSSFSQGFKGVREFDSDQVPSLDFEEPPNCWALPVVTLTSIAVALPNVDHSLIKQLISGVSEGLIFVKLIETNLDGTGDLTNTRKAAEIVWIRIDLCKKWLDVDLQKVSQQGKHTKEILEELSSTAKNRFNEFKKKNTNVCLKENPSHWPVKVLAANSMYRISQTILLNYASRNDQSNRLFGILAVMISDILGACLTNLHCVISKKCLSSSIEDREESVRHATFLLGKTEKILEILDQRSIPILDPEKMACIDQWRMHKMQSPLPITPIESNMDSSISSDLYLTVE